MEDQAQIAASTALPDVTLERSVLLDELYRRYSGSQAGSLAFRRKKYAWLAVVDGTKLVKRLVDIAGACVGLAVLSPLFAVVALAIRRTDGGPSLFWQTRVGRHGREFRFPKFRSMVVHAEAIRDELATQNVHGDGVTFKVKRDPRITPVGKIIRKLSIDELPQLWCVLVGDMSLVGPRPPLPAEVARYRLHDRRRLEVTPGITCTWQVGGRSDIPFERQVQLDIDYVHSQSVWLDLKILLATIPAVLTGRGAY
jgi:lipopolysaccharide/colanic/teichoic acid biosynthesis glycosyltransferase